MSSPDWSKAAEFVPSWYSGAKKPPAPAAPPANAAAAKPAEKNNNNNKSNNNNNNSNNANNHNKNSNSSNNKNNNNHNNKSSFSIQSSSQPSNSPPLNAQNTNNNNRNSNKQNNTNNNNSKNNNNNNQKNNNNNNTNKSSSTSLKPSSPKIEKEEEEEGTSFWVTPPMAPAQDPSQKQKLNNNNNNNNNQNQDRNNENSTKSGDKNTQGGFKNDLPPSLDLGLSANASEFKPGQRYIANPNSERQQQIKTHVETSTADSLKTAISALGVKVSDKVVASSKLKASAGVFIPAGFVPKMKTNVKPVSIPGDKSLIPTGSSGATGSGDSKNNNNSNNSSATVDTAGSASEAESRGRDLSLIDTWCLYFDDDIKKSAEEFDPYLICHLSDIQTFWRVFQNVPSVSRQADNTNYYLFREGVMPKWEDERNDGGGAWTFKFHLTRSSETIDATWERLCCQIVGENWSDEVRPTINGLVAKIRPRSVAFQIWVSKRVDTLLPELQNRALAPVMAAAMWEYIPHPKKEDENSKKEASSSHLKKRKPDIRSE